MSKRTSILKKLMIITTVMTMTLGGSMTAFAAEGGVCTCDEQATVVVTVDEQAATENEKEILGNPDEQQTESETAIYEEYTKSDMDEFAKETAEEIEMGERYVDPENQKLATECADDREEGEAPIDPLAEGNAHITITDSSLEDEDVLQGRTEIIANTTDNKIPLEADEESAEATIYFVSLNSTNTEVLDGKNIEAAVTVPVATDCDDPANAVAYVDPQLGTFDAIDKVALKYDAEHGTWTINITLKSSYSYKTIDGTDYPVSYYNYGTIYLVKYDAVKKEVVVEPVQPGVEPSSNEDETVLAVVDASGVQSSTEVSTVAPVNDYYQFNLNAAKAIREAAYGATVDIDAGEYVSFADFVIEEIDKRPDLTINVNYIDAKNGHSKEQIVIPARQVASDGTVLGESRIEEPETKYYGFRFVDTKVNA